MAKVKPFLCMIGWHRHYEILSVPPQYGCKYKSCVRHMPEHYNDKTGKSLYWHCFLCNHVW